MKNVRMILPMVAFLFALGGAFATVASVTAPEFIAPVGSTTPCTQISQTCGTAGPFVCTAIQQSTGNQFRVYDDKVGTACARQLTRNVNTPISLP